MSEELKQALLESKGSINNSSYSKLVDECIERNNINVQNYDGNTLLIYVCYNANTSKLISLLLDNGANVNIQNNGGRTALIGASFCDIVFGVGLLLKYGANPVLKDKHGRTAKSYARDDKILKILEEAEKNYIEESNIENDPLGELEEEIRRVLKL